MSATTKARKGDLILVERVTRNHYSVAAHAEAKAAGRTLPDVETDYEFGVVASATRDGQVKTWQSVGWGDQLLDAFDQPIRNDHCWVVSAKRVDVTGVMTAAKAHHYPGHPGQPMAYASLDEARALARTFASEERAA